MLRWSLSTVVEAPVILRLRALFWGAVCGARERWMLGPRTLDVGSLKLSRNYKNVLGAGRIVLCIAKHNWSPTAGGAAVHSTCPDSHSRYAPLSLLSPLHIAPTNPNPNHRDSTSQLACRYALQLRAAQRASVFAYMHRPREPRMNPGPTPSRSARAEGSLFCAPTFPSGAGR